MREKAVGSRGASRQLRSGEDGDGGDNGDGRYFSKLFPMNIPTRSEGGKLAYNFVGRRGRPAEKRGS